MTMPARPVAIPHFVGSRRRAGSAAATWIPGLGSAVLLFGWPLAASAFLEDICISKKAGQLEVCIAPTSSCKLQKGAPNRACPAQVLQFATIPPGRSMIHADSTYFIAQALGYRADVAYWIVAYNEVADYGLYAPIDQCGVQASSANSGSSYVSAAFNGFQRTNTSTDGPLYHYVVPYSPTGLGTDAHGASGVQAVYPWRYPAPGYPATIDDVYQGTLYNLRQWGMQADSSPGLLCAVGLTVPNGGSNFSGKACLSGVTVSGTVPFLEGRQAGARLSIQTGPKILDNSQGTVDYRQLGPWLQDKSRTTGTLWLDPAKPPVPVQLARFGLYLHSLQDVASHSTFCGDDAPSPPGGSDPGTYMGPSSGGIGLQFGTYCATGPHIAGHVQETATGDQPLPLRDYSALNITLDELVLFGNNVAKANGWIVNPQLLPPDVVGGKSSRGESAAELKARLIGSIVSGQAGTRGEVYASGTVTLPLQQTQAQARLQAMNAALGAYSEALMKSAAPAAPPYTPLQPMPGNSTRAGDRSACFK